MKRTIVFLTGILLTTALCITFATAANVTFGDVKSSDWFYPNVKALVESGAIAGYTDGTFKPQNTVTRAEFAKVLVAAMKLQEVVGNDFADTKESWAESYISTAIADGIIEKSEYGDNYKPDNPITRLEIAKMLVRALHIPPSDKIGPFTDLINGYTTAAYNECLITGTKTFGNRYFYPDNNASRAEASVMIQRAVQYKADPDGFKNTEAKKSAADSSYLCGNHILNVSILPDQVNTDSLDEFKSYLMTAAYLNKPQLTLNVSGYNENDYSFDNINNYLSNVNFDICYNKGYSASCGMTWSTYGNSASIKLDFQYSDCKNYDISNIKKVASQDELNSVISDAAANKLSSVTIIFKDFKSYYYDYSKAFQNANNHNVLSNGYYSYSGGSSGENCLNNSIQKVNLLYQNLDFNYEEAKTVSSYQDLYNVLSVAVANKDYRLVIAMDNYNGDAYNLGKALLDINTTMLAQQGYCAKADGKLEYMTSPKLMQIYLSYEVPGNNLVFQEDEGNPILHNEQEWYNYIKNALLNNETSIQYNLTYSSDIGDVIKKVLEQNADMAYVDRLEEHSDGTVTFKYRFTPETLNKMKTQTDAKADKIISQIIKQGMSDTEKAKAIHDYIVLNTTYDIENYRNNTIPNEDYTAYGILINHTGVCQGYAAAFKLLAEKAGLPCISVTGTGNGGNHAWNMAKLDGKVGFIDVTFDDPVPDQGKVRYDYFFLSKDDMNKDHAWDIDKYAEKYLNY